MHRQLLTCLASVLFVVPLLAEPPSPETYRVSVRYQIYAYTGDRIVQYREMLKKLEKQGLVLDPRPEGEEDDPRATLLTGTIPAKDARGLLLERHVRAILLADKNDARMKDLNDKPDTQARIQIELTPQASIERQRELVDKVRTCMTPLGFHEGFAYDHQAHTRLVGMIAKSKLEILLYDLRSLPEGGRVPASPANQTAIRVVEVMPEGYPEIPSMNPAPKPVERESEKIAPALLDVVNNKEQAAKLARLEIILTFDPTSKDHAWEDVLHKAAPDLIVEGRIGTLVTVTVKAEMALKLASLPEVALIRLPVSATRTTIANDAVKEEDNAEALKASGLERLHNAKFKGKGINLAVVDSDFRGWEDLVGNRFPKATRYIDFTAERSANLSPEPFPDGKGLGHGTRAALVALMAAPDADLTLVRIDPAAPYQLEQLLRQIHGDAAASPLLDIRRHEIDDTHNFLSRRRTALLAERKEILSDFGQDEIAKQKRVAYFQKEKDLERDEQTYADLSHRYLDTLMNYRELRRVRAVVSPFVWNEGHPVDGGSAPSRFFDDRPFRGTLWFQAAGNTRGQTWTGIFRDADGDGVMEFAPLAGSGSLDKTWQLEMNRLGWQPNNVAKDEKADAGMEIPAKARLRITVQWREPHDPEFFNAGEDVYAHSLAKLRLLLLRQLDPEGKKRPTDDLQLVEQTAGVPLRIQNLANSAVYEQSLQFEVADAGQYVLRVEGNVPPGTRPPGYPSLPAQQKNWDLKLRIFIETLSEGGHVVFRDYVTDDAGIAAPADAHQVIAVGAVDAALKARPYSITGAPLDLELLRKPDLLTFDAFSVDGSDAAAGTEYAASYAAGTAACLLGAGVAPEDFFKDIKAHPGQVLRVPDKVPERTPKR